MTTSNSSTLSSNARYALAALRLSLGLIFLWAFLDKTFGLTWNTPSGSGWLFGSGEGSPTKGYLSSSYGPLGNMFQAMAGNAVVNWLFMLGLLCVGLCLTFGSAVRFGGLNGVLLVLLMYASHPAPWADPHGTNPLIDTHIVEACALALVALTPSGDTWGMAKWWRANLPANAKWLR